MDSEAVRLILLEINKIAPIFPNQQQRGLELCQPIRRIRLLRQLPGGKLQVENLLEGIEVRPDIDYLEHKEKLDALAEHENR